MLCCTDLVIRVEQWCFILEIINLNCFGHTTYACRKVTSVCGIHLAYTYLLNLHDTILHDEKANMTLINEASLNITYRLLFVL
jgi:hypothetical protein